MLYGSEDWQLAWQTFITLLEFCYTHFQPTVLLMLVTLIILCFVILDNPCPQQGDIVNIRLSESLESLQHPDGTFRPMIVDTYFQMNYATGEWKRVKKFREKEPDAE